jgi:hypothetical protein
MTENSILLERLEVISNYSIKRIDTIEAIIKSIEAKSYLVDKEFLKIKYELRDIYKQIDNIQSIQKRSGIMYFLKQNWWKLGGFILAFSTILGAIGEYLYRLPPPI